jgi:hypothetical protein
MVEDAASLRFKAQNGTRIYPHFEDRAQDGPVPSPRRAHRRRIMQIMLNKDDKGKVKRAQRDEENDVERNRLSLPSKDPSFVNVSTEHAWIRDSFRVQWITSTLMLPNPTPKEMFPRHGFPISRMKPVTDATADTDISSDVESRNLWEKRSGGSMKISLQDAPRCTAATAKPMHRSF